MTNKLDEQNEKASENMPAYIPEFLPELENDDFNIRIRSNAPKVNEHELLTETFMSLLEEGIEQPEEVEAPDPSEETEIPDVFEETEVLDMFEETEVSEAPEEAEVPEMPEEAEVPEIPEETEVPEIPEKAEVHDEPEKPDISEKTPKKGEKRKKRSAKKIVIKLILTITLTAAAVWGLLTYVVGVYINRGSSAYPMIKDGDFCVTFRLGEPKKEDEVGYASENGVKFARVVALENDVADITNGCLTVNGQAVEGEYGAAGETAVEYPYTVPSGCAFLLNDCRNDVNDSRTVGAVPFDEIKGKVIFIMRVRGI